MHSFAIAQDAQEKGWRLDASTAPHSLSDCAFFSSARSKGRENLEGGHRVLVREFEGGVDVLDEVGVVVHLEILWHRSREREGRRLNARRVRAGRAGAAQARG